VPLFGQLVDKNKVPNAANEGIRRPLIGGSYPSQIGEGRTGTDWNASSNVMAFDPFRAIRRGRQLFQRKFSRLEGLGPITGDGFGDIGTDVSIGAGFADSCAACHGRPRGSAGFGGNVVTRPDSRDAPHLFGLGLKEMLADEITADLRAIREAARGRASRAGFPVVGHLASKSIDFGVIRAFPDGSVDTSGVEGVDPDLRVRPFSAHGGTISIREFVVGALRNEMGLAIANDPDLVAAQFGPVSTASGIVLNGQTDTIERPPAEEGDVGSVGQRKKPALQPFLVKNIFTDFKRHDRGPSFHERNYDGTIRTHFMTTPLWGVGSTSPYGHDGRSVNLTEVILRHGGEAQDARDAFTSLDGHSRNAVLRLLESLILFPPDDTASNLDPGDRGAAEFPQFRHGSIRLTVLFNDPSIVE
jgi:hypothetical protein